ncbi:MAG: MFS transporter [Atopobiaceae bacterium]|nr:MFS transporter [Atopobiaceae bacterium]
MDKPHNPKRARILKIVLFVLALGAFVMICTDIGQTPAAAFGPERCEDASVASSNENGTVIAVNNGERLLFIDPDGQLVGVYGLDDEGAPITEALVIHQAGTDVYVAGTKHAGDGENIKTEGVLKFSMKGDYLGAVWKKDYEEGDIHVSPSISDITTDDEGDLMLVQFGQQKMHTILFKGTVTKVAQGGADEQVLREAVYPSDSFPYDIRYDPASNRCAMTDIYGNLFVEPDDGDESVPVSTGDRTLMIQAFDIRGDMAVMYDENSHALVRADNLYGDIQLRDLYSTDHCVSVEISGDTVTTVLETGVVRTYDLASGSMHDLTEAPLITSFAVRTMALLLSKVYLVILLIVLAIWWFVHSIGSGHRSKVRRAIVATAVSLICMIAMLFHLVDLFSATVSSRHQSMSQIVSQVSVTSPAELGDAATNESKRAQGLIEASDDGEDLSTIILNVEGILASSFANNNGVQCTLYTITEDGEIRYLFSNHRDSIVMGPARGDDIASAVSTVIVTANKHEGEGLEKAYFFAHDGEVQSVTRRDKSGHDVLSCVAPLIAKDGTCCTAIEVSCHAESMLHSIVDNMLSILLVFLMATATIYVLSDEAIRSGSAFLRYRSLRDQGVEWAETLLGRPLCFVVNIAFGMDAAFAVVIAKEMLAGSGLDSTAFVWGVPALAITLGTTFGTIIHALLCSRVSGRSFALPMLLLGILSQILCFFAVMNNWFVVFLACKLVSSASFATTEFVSKNLAGSTAGKDLGDKHLSLVVNRSSVNIAGKGAAVVASVVGGALASVGNQWVYIAGCLVSVAAIPLLLLALPKGRVISTHGDEANLQNVIRFLCSPIMLATLFFAIFPTVLASGYKSYILPLFLDSVGVSKTDIASLFALGNVILYGFTDTLITHRNARGRWVMTWVALIGLGVLFALFSYNQSPTWAVVAVVVITVLAWLAGDWKHTARWWAKKDYGFSFDQSQATLNLEAAVVKNAQAPVLAALLSLGASTCCLILGIFFCISGVCYYFPTRKRGDSA